MLLLLTDGMMTGRVCRGTSLQFIHKLAFAVPIEAAELSLECVIKLFVMVAWVLVDVSFSMRILRFVGILIVAGPLINFAFDWPELIALRTGRLVVTSLAITLAKSSLYLRRSESVSKD